MRYRSFLSILGLCVSFSNVNDASGAFLDGQQMTLQNLFQGSPSVGYTTTFTVNSTPGTLEVNGWGNEPIRMDVFDTSEASATILIQNFRSVTYGGSPNLIYFEDTNLTIDFFKCVVLDTNIAGLTASRISFTEDTISVDIGGLTSGTTSYIRLDIETNSPPDAVATILSYNDDQGEYQDVGDYFELSCEELPDDAGHGALITLDASGSTDPDGDDLDYEWSVAEGQIQYPTAETTDAIFPVGVHQVTLTVYDLDESGERKGTLDTAMVTVVVVDETPPLVMVSTDLAALWPANNKMVPVIICVEASDACSDPGSLDVMCCITSSQPDDSDGTGELVGDVDGADGFAEPVPVTLEYFTDDDVFVAMVGLRAERDGEDKAGRVYSIYVEALDGEGNSGQASTTVVVPHDGRSH